ncbi:MAG: glucan biosynthesis protein G [Pseudomonadota bacterium]
MIDRRTLMTLMAAGLVPLPKLGLAQGNTLPSLLEVARGMAAQAYIPPTGILSPPFDDLNYNSYRGIRPRPGAAALLPQGEDFALDLMPPGFYFTEPLQIQRQIDGVLQEQDFSPALFDFDDRYFNEVPETSEHGGFSGARLRYPINNPDVMDEVVVFQGASYFRAIGEAMVYGLSARAVAIGTGGADPEEFPRFSLLRVHDGAAGQIRVEGLIDSPSLTGHLDLNIRPGPDTVMDASLTLFPRAQIDTIGVAPLTSMYLKGPMRAAVSDDFRPNVHDSDLLFIENGAGERLWRPIANPIRVETSSFADTNPSCFGLYQTTRQYEDFHDPEARYQDRPSALVVPKGDWGAGAVMLVEIPTGTEFLDNIVAFWRPEAPLLAGGEYRFDYTLTWTKGAPPLHELAPVTQSRSGRDHDQPGARRFVLDFDIEPEGLTPDLSVFGSEDPGILYGTSLFGLPEGRGTRVTFLLKPEVEEALELRLQLRDAEGAPATPVWLHRWTRKRDGGV